MDRKYRFISCLAAAVSVFILLGNVPAAAKSSDDIRDEIRELEQQAEKNKAQMDALEQQIGENYSQMKDLVAGKNAIDQQIALLYDQMDNLNARIRAYAQLVADKQDQLDIAQESLNKLKEEYKDRIRAMEEQGSLTYWAVLFKASSFSDLLDRINMIREIAEADQRRIEEIASATQLVIQSKEALEAEKTELEATRQELTASELQLNEKRAQADALLAELFARSEEFQILLNESEEKQEELMEQLARKEVELDEAEYREWLESYVPPATEIPSPEVPESDADWITPVPWYILTSPFGMRMHPILGYYRMHNGVDLACDEGTPIYASRGGQVVTADYQPDGAGNYVQINHGDGYMSVYMHMTRYVVAVGDYVAPGQIIGYVGNTGLSKGSHLHFGISYRGTYVNPMEYIG